MADDKELMRFQRPSEITVYTDHSRVRDIQKAGGESLEHQNISALLGANGVRMMAELSNYAGNVMDSVVDGHLGRIRGAANDQEKHAIMQEFSYQMMEVSGTRIKRIVEAAADGIETEVRRFDSYRPPKKSFWERLFDE